MYRVLRSDYLRPYDYRPGQRQAYGVEGGIVLYTTFSIRKINNMYEHKHTISTKIDKAYEHKHTISTKIGKVYEHKQLLISARP